MTGRQDQIVRPAAALHGSVRVPGDKSVSHRAAMMAALAEGSSVLRGFLASEDCLHTLDAVAALGARVERDADTIRVEGTGGAFVAPRQDLDLGNSGTGLRLLAGLLAGQPFVSSLTGDASLCSRPMGRIKEPLERMGASIELQGARGCPPLRIRGGALRGIEYHPPVASAQVKSCVLLAGLFADGPTAVVETKPTRDHTERMLCALGFDLRVDGLRVELHGGGCARPRFPGRDWSIPTDFSSAAFWMVGAACWPGAEVEIRDVGLNPRRTALLDVLRRMGAQVEVQAAGRREAGPEWEPCGTVVVRGAALRGTEVGGDEIPNLIDELPLVAVAGALAEGETLIRDAAELRVKESDRIRTTVSGLRALGVAADETPDGLRVRGPCRIGGGAVESAGDHRIAMAMAVLALRAAAPVEIRDVACVATSYPGFWDDLAVLAVR